MKEKIILILTFIISFTLYTNTVDAATELTCLYEAKSPYSALKIIQYKDGTKKAARYGTLTESKPEMDSKDWNVFELAEFDDNSELTDCPQYSGFNKKEPYKIYFSSSSDNKYGKLYESKNEIDSNIKSNYDSYYVPGEKSNMDDELSSGRWITGCKYKKLNSDKYVYLYFNETEIRVVVGENVIPTLKEGIEWGARSYALYSDIQVSRVLKEYENYGGCPINLYSNLMTSGISQGSTIYSLDRLASGSYMTTYVYMGEKDKDDPTPTDPEDCSQLLGDDVIKFINEIMKWIRIFIPILLIGLGILDFTKATFSKTEEDMKKTREKFIKRIIAAVLVFLVPIFVNLLLDLANSVWSWINPETCIK